MHENNPSRGPDYVVVLWVDKSGINVLPNNDPGIRVSRRDGEPGHGDIIEFLLFYRTRERHSVKVSFADPQWADILEGGNQELTLGRRNRSARVVICENAPVSKDPVKYRVELELKDRGPCGPSDEPSMIVVGGGG